MRIIGGKDYYDNALAYGADSDVVFVRHKDNWVPSLFDRNKQHKVEEDYISGDPFTKISDDVKIVGIELWFCGKHYHCFEATIHHQFKRPPEKLYFWTGKNFKSNKYREFIYSYRPDLKESDELHEKKWGSKYSKYRTLSEQTKQSYLDDSTNFYEKWLIDNRITIAMARSDGVRGEGKVWKIDGWGLNDVQFQRVMPAYQAYQEISMWVGGVLPKTGNPMVQITDDKIKISKAGFDNWSFRKKVR